MFPSANYFRDIPCPFFSRVSCPRPHCHFKHVQVSSQSNFNTNTSSSSSSISIPPDANETLNKLINQLSTAAAANSTTTTATTTNLTPSVDLTSILHSTLLQSLTTALTNAFNTNTTPSSTTTNNNEISDKLTQAISTIATQLHQHQTQPVQTSNSAETVPEYRPTPIAELERRRRIQPTIKTEPIDFDSDEYTHATFSPPSSSPPPTSLIESTPIEEPKSNISTIPKPSQPVSSNSIPKQSQPSVTDDKHLWVAPPVRRKLSSSSDHNDFDERKASLAKKVTPTEKTQSVTRVGNKPTATVKPNVINNVNKVITPTNPMIKRIPKKTPPPAPTTTSKVRVMDVDLDKVPVTSTISLDTETNSNKKMISTAVKRASNSTDEIPQKKPKTLSSIKQNVTTTIPTTIKKIASITNGVNTSKPSDEDDELALFDHAFPSSKVSETAISSKKFTPTIPPTSVHQFTSRYSSIATTSDDQNPSASTNYTRAETSSDGRRIAHKPKVHPNLNTTPSTTSLRPLVDPNSSVNKIPFKTRQEYLTFFVNELKKKPTNSTISTPTTPVFSRAQSIEKEIFDKSTSKNSYLNFAAKYLRQIRAEETNTPNKTETSSPKKANVQRLVVSHSAMLTGGKADNLSFGIKKQKEVDVKTLTDNELYTLLLVYKASEKDLMENGYPAFSLDFPDKVLIKNKNPIYNSTVKIHSSDPNTRLCCRCSKTYKINNEGEYVQQEECIYHWGRLRTQRVAGQIEKNYSCCSSKTTTIGCAVAQYHVQDSDDTQLLAGYVKTQPLRKQLSPDESYGIFALDCEMCYTINGLELVRVSVVNHKLQPVYETLVKPHQKVLDYNTRWSGITEQQLQGCNVRIEDVQRRLLKLFNTKSILIGHSLESDLKALKIVHETIVDTSLVFPHARGKPYKRALRTLMAEYLTKIIQENAEGHDSMEDAISCMELMLWKIKQDLKTSTSTH